jgi:hypothetical protein
LKIWLEGAYVSFKQNPSTASFQHGVLESRVDMDVSGRILRIWMPAIHAGMTEICIALWASVSS